MAWYYDNYGEPIYVPNADPRYHLREGDIFPDLAPVSLRTAPFYCDPVQYQYRRSFRDQHPHFGHGVELVIPAGEEVHIRREHPYPHPYYPHDGVHPGGVWVLERRRPHRDDECTFEFFAPQLSSESRARKVKDALDLLPGVQRVETDRCLMKVVVKGRRLCEEQVLRRLKRVEHMDRSVLWRHHHRC